MKIDWTKKMINGFEKLKRSSTDMVNDDSKGLCLPEPDPKSLVRFYAGDLHLSNFYPRVYISSSSSSLKGKVQEPRRMVSLEPNVLFNMAGQPAGRKLTPSYPVYPSFRVAKVAKRSRCKRTIAPL